MVYSRIDRNPSFELEIQETKEVEIMDKKS